MPKRKPEPSERVREAYRGTSLIARTFPHGVRGKAWCAGREIAATEGTSEAAVIASLRQRVDEAIVVETAVDSVPYPEQGAYAHGLGAIRDRITPRQHAMLRAHCAARRMTLTGEALAEASELASWATARQQYGALGRRLGEAMLFEPAGRGGTPMWIRVVARPEDTEPVGGKARWQLRPELASALKALELV